jgi:histone deacetylase 11
VPGLGFGLLDQRVLLPMRWAVAGTVLAARQALAGHSCRNLSGGHHHASRSHAEGFCVYNDVGIAVQELTRDGSLAADARLLVIDVDAHHGKGNAEVFLHEPRVQLLDVFNRDIYPQTKHTRQRVDLPVPLAVGTRGPAYLAALDEALQCIDASATLAFVIAGTDVLATDRLGGLGLSVAGCAERDERIAHRLEQLKLPAVWLGGGGYGPQSRAAMVAGVRRVAGLQRLSMA